LLDLVLLHPPSVYDFRKRSILFGPISDVIPSTPIFEMYPLGFVNLSSYLSKKGLRVRILNVAVKMLKSKNYDFEKEIKKIHSRAFGIDLHWLPHAQGGLELAKIIRKYHPESKIIFGGLSSTYFHKELISYPQVDFVLRGDSTEEPLFLLLQAIKNNQNFSLVPNLTYKEKNGETKVNPLSYVPKNLDYTSIDYKHLIKSVLKYRDFWGFVPFKDWVGYPITAIFSCRGCTQDCTTCGGSAFTYNHFSQRSSPAFRSPELIASDVFSIGKILRGPIFILGDILQPGKEYAENLLANLKKKRCKNQIVLEFFDVPLDDILEKISQSIPYFNFQISLESHDPEIRRLFGRPEDNQRLEKMIETSLRLGCQKFDLFFMTGLPKQTYQSVMDTVKYCEHLLEKFGNSKKLFPYISPLAPFVDPGSMVFENPEKFGYKLFYKSLEQHRLALLAPSWKHMLNYQTEWMTKDQIVESTYQAARELNKIKFKYGLLEEKKFLEIDGKINQAQEAIEKIDRIMEISDEKEREEKLKHLKEEFENLSSSTITDKKELEWSLHPLRFNFSNFFFSFPLFLISLFDRK
jgi:B12-binding domain/radical SAM domain protein